MAYHIYYPGQQIEFKREEVGCDWEPGFFIGYELSGVTVGLFPWLTRMDSRQNGVFWLYSESMLRPRESEGGC